MDTTIPNQFSREAIEEFKEIYEAEFNETLTDDEAQEMGERLLSLFKILAESDKKQEEA